MSILTKQSSWLALQKHYRAIEHASIFDMHKNDPGRAARYQLAVDDLQLNYANNLIADHTIALLNQLAGENHLAKKIEDMFSGKLVNQSEQLPALHPALRNQNTQTSAMKAVFSAMVEQVGLIRNSEYVGYSGKPIKDIVNIGIGGSDLGPIMAYHALSAYVVPDLRFHFFRHYEDSKQLQHLDPETTLFIVCSKSFTTAETLFLAQRAKDWLLTANQHQSHQQIVAVTENKQAALDFGVSEENTYLIPEGVGGRFSVWSAVGLSLMLAIGVDNFTQFLAGAKAMDEHFTHSDFTQNMPVILALLDIWTINFLQASTKVIIPYSKRLIYLPEYLQQLHMESLGKSVTQEGEPVDYMTGVAVWGSIGSNSQHSFHQILMQGTQLHSVDFILPLIDDMDSETQHAIKANCLAQSHVMMQGYDKREAVKDKQDNIPHRVFSGNCPSNIITMKQLTPRALGALIALYEHKVFVQASILNINPFDQWGVERGKAIASTF